MNISIRTYIALILLVLILFYILSGTVTNIPVIGDISHFIAEVLDTVVKYFSDIIREAVKDVLRDATEQAFDEAGKKIEAL